MSEKVIVLVWIISDSRTEDGNNNKKMSSQGEMEENLLRVGSDAKAQSNSIESLYLRAKVWSEVSKMWRIALPSSLFRMTSFGSIIVAQAFIGHSSELGLAAYALLQSTFIRFLYGLTVNKLLISVQLLVYIWIWKKYVY